MDKDVLRDLKQSARQQGWQVLGTNGGHLRWVPPQRDKPIVHGHKTAGDGRTTRNLISELRRSGLRWP